MMRPTASPLSYFCCPVRAMALREFWGFPTVGPQRPQFWGHLSSILRLLTPSPPLTSIISPKEPTFESSRALPPSLSGSQSLSPLFPNCCRCYHRPSSGRYRLGWWCYSSCLLSRWGSWSIYSFDRALGYGLIADSPSLFVDRKCSPDVRPEPFPETTWATNSRLLRLLTCSSATIVGASISSCSIRNFLSEASIAL